MSEPTVDRRPTRTATVPDVPRIDAAAITPELRDALSQLLLTLADDEFVQGFRDSEWTGIAPMLEEDVAFSSLAQDEIGHARVLYELRAALTCEDADATAYGRRPDAYVHARLLDHPRTDWAFSIARRWLYDTADAVRLGALHDASFRPLAEVVGKIRREETYHLMHLDAWLRRLADGNADSRSRLQAALDRLLPDAASVFAPLSSEPVLLGQGILAEPMSDLAARHWAQVDAVLGGLGLRVPHERPSPEGGRERGDVAEGFRSLWSEFTSVRRLDEAATW